MIFASLLYPSFWTDIPKYNYLFFIWITVHWFLLFKVVLSFGAWYTSDIFFLMDLNYFQTITIKNVCCSKIILSNSGILLYNEKFHGKNEAGIGKQHHANGFGLHNMGWTSCLDTEGKIFSQWWELHFKNLIQGALMLRDKKKNLDKDWISFQLPFLRAKSNVTVFMKLALTPPGV